MKTMRMPLCRLLLSLVTVLVLAGVSWAHMYTVNVKDFGAFGDGVTDDTLAIQNAISNAQAMAVSRPSVNTGYHFTAPVVFFPHGVYRVTDSVTIANINLAGEGNALIQMTADNDHSVLDFTTDIFIGTYVWRASISGFTFYGGRHQLYIGNPNIDTGNIRIEKCDFYSSGGVAIHIREGSDSTTLTIRDCKFQGCDQILVNYCMCGFSDSWISTSSTMQHKAVIVNYASLLAENICGVPSVTSDYDQRWIDNYGNVTCRKFRFGGEQAGFTPVVNFATYDYTYPIWPSAVVLDDCDIYACGNHKRKGAVYLEAVPNTIEVNKCRGLIDIPVLNYSPSLDLIAALANAPWYAMHFNISHNSIIAPWITDLPEVMRPYQEGDILGDAQPTTGKWRRGHFIRNRNEAHWYVWTPSATPPSYGSWTQFTNPYPDAKLAPYGWLCTADGTPGTWAPIWYKHETSTQRVSPRPVRPGRESSQQ
jgi:hypothetical protein